jgi:hypothetical protein
MLRKLKDTALSKGAKTALNVAISEYGKVLRIDLDTSRKTLHAEILLDGEHEAVQLKVGRYELHDCEGRYSLILYEIETSRAWLNTLAGNFLEGREVKIPAKYAKMLNKVV